MSNLIKGYLPIRVNLPSQNADKTEDTFMFVKEHSSMSESSPRTLFVTNTPIYPSIQTKILLQSLFERYADVETIRVAQRPTKEFSEEREASMEELTLSMFTKEIRTIDGSKGQGKMGMEEEEWYNQGRYAHVIFSSTKGLKKFMSNFLKKKKKKKGGVSDSDSSLIKFGKLEVQELQDISQKLYRAEKKKFLQNKEEDDEDEDSDNDSEEEEAPYERPTGIMALAQANKNRIMSRDALKEMCNKIMQKYEDDEAEAQTERQRAMNEPDEDGFVTVSYATNVGDVMEFEKDGNLGSTGVGGGRRKRERTRSSKKNLIKGSDKLEDFYRFQLKENKKRNLEQLKVRFQEDLKRVKQMSEEKKFRPF